MANKIHITLEVDDKGTAKIKGFGGTADKAFAKIKKNATAGAAQAGKMERAWGSATKKMKLHWKAYSAAAAVAMTAVAAITVAGAKKAIAAASDLQEVQSKFDVVFAGQQAKAEGWSKTLVDSYYMSTREAKQYLSSVQDLLVPMGMASDKAGVMSNEVVKLAADLGSFNNLPTEQVMMNIQSALTGEYESMKKYGIVINATTVQQKALNMGLAATKGDLNAGMKAQAAYAMMVEGSTKAIGDRIRTQDSAANQEVKFKNALEDITALLGQALIPYYQAALKEINSWLKANKDVIAQNIPLYIGKIGDAIVFVIKTMKFFHNAWLGIKLVGTVAIQSIAVALDELFKGLRLFLKPLDLIFEGLKKLGRIEVNPFDKIEESLGTFRASSGDVTASVLADIKKTNAGYDATIKTVEGWSKKLKENAKAQTKTSKSIIKDVAGQNKAVLKIAKKTGVEQVKISAKTIKANIKAVADFSKRYQKYTLGDYKYAIEVLKDKANADIEAGANREQVERLLAADIKKITSDETKAATKLAADKIKLTKYYATEATNSHKTLTANISKMTQKEVTEALKAAKDKTKAVDDYAKESTKIYDRMYDDAQKLDLGDYHYSESLLDKRYKNYKEHLISLAKQDDKYSDGVKLLDKWLADEKEKLWDRQAREHGDMIDTMKVAWKDFSKDSLNISKTMYEGWKKMMGQMKDALSDTFYAAFTGNIKDIGNIWKTFTSDLKKTFLKMIADIAAEKIIMYFKNAWSGDPTGQGTIEKMIGIDVPFLTFASGGKVPGAYNGKKGFAGDTVPIMATPGEYMVRREVAQNPAIRSLLDVLNQSGAGAGMIAAGKNIPALGATGMYGGGIVEPQLGHYGWGSFFHSIGHAISSTVSGITSTIGSVFSSITDIPIVGDILKGVFETINSITNFLSQNDMGRALAAIANVALAVGMPEAIPAQLAGAGISGGLTAATGGSWEDALWNADTAAALTGGTEAATSYMKGTQTVKMGDKWVEVPKSRLETVGGQPLYLNDNYESIAVSLPENNLGTYWSIAKQAPESALKDLMQQSSDTWTKAKTLAQTPWDELVKMGVDKAGNFTKESWEALKNVPSDAWKGISSIPERTWAFMRSFDLSAYLMANMSGILGNMQLSLASASGGSALDSIGSRLGLKYGGFSYGPAVGYPMTLHGAEEVVPLDEPYRSKFRDAVGADPNKIADAIMRKFAGASRGSDKGGPLNITIELGPEVLQAYIEEISDDVRVKAERRDAGTRRLY